MITKFGSDACVLAMQEKSAAQIASEESNCVELLMWADLWMKRKKLDTQSTMAVCDFVIANRVSMGFPLNRPQGNTRSVPKEGESRLESGAG